MPGLGTLINVAGILAGGLLGLTGKKLIKENIQETLMRAIGLCVMFIGIGGAMEKMLYVNGGILGTQGTMMMIGSFTVGTLVGDLPGKLGCTVYDGDCTELPILYRLYADFLCRSQSDLAGEI